MQSKVYEKVMSAEKNSQISSVLVTAPQMSKIQDINIIKKAFEIGITEKISRLNFSIKDAKKVLLQYKSKLCDINGNEDDCITPLCESTKMPMLFYKREDLTSIKAYKVRGALYQMSKLVEKMPGRKLRFIAASTGNHALGVLKAAEILKVSNVVICISQSVTEFKKKKLANRVLELKEKGVNAELLVKGDNFDQTNKFAKRMVELDENSFYIDPYNNHNAVAGQGTIGLEILSQLNEKLSDKKDKKLNLEKLTVIIPIGGGGLISGISCALKSEINKFPMLKSLNLKLIGASLKDLNSFYGDAIKVESVGEHNISYIDYFVDEKIKIDDNDMEKGIEFVFNDINTKVEGASAGTLKPVLNNLVSLSSKNIVVCVLSGGNVV